MSAFGVSHAVQTANPLIDLIEFMRQFMGESVTIRRTLNGQQVGNAIPYDIPANAQDFNRMFRGHQDGGFMSLVFEGSDNFYICDTLVVSRGWRQVLQQNMSISRLLNPLQGMMSLSHILNPIRMGMEELLNPLQQFFREGDQNCMITPILKHFEEKLAVTLLLPIPHNKHTKEYLNLRKRTSKDRLNVEICKKWMEDAHERGVDKDADQHHVNHLRIAVRVQRPIMGTTCKTMQLFEMVSTLKAKKRFGFVNVSLNHVEHYEDSVLKNYMGLKMTSTTVYLTKAEMTAKHVELPHNAYRVNPQGEITMILDTHNNYAFANPFTARKKEFMKGGLEYCMLDWQKEPELSQFILSATRSNGTIEGPAFKDIQRWKTLAPTNEYAKAMLNALELRQSKMHHIDLIKAFANFSKFPGADDCKLLGKITDFRETDYVMPGVKGFYHVTLDFSRADPQFMIWNEVLGFPYVTDRVYTTFTLAMFDRVGVTYIPSFGCWGSDVEVDFTTCDMLNKMCSGCGVDMMNGECLQCGEGAHGLSGYAKFVGACQSNYEHTTYMLDVPEQDIPIYRDIVFDPLGPKVVVYEDGTVGLTYKNFDNAHLCHIAAQILDLVAAQMMTQCMTFSPTNLGRICSDGLYTIEPVEFDNSKFQKKERLTFANAAMSCYRSNMEPHVLPLYMYRRRPDDVDTEKLVTRHNMREVLTGPGGSGKTTWVATQCYIPGLSGGFVRPCLLAHSIALRQKMREDNPHIPARCFQDVLYELADKRENYRKRYNFFACDESSTLSRYYQQKMCEWYDMTKIIFMGDIGYQALPVPHAVLIPDPTGTKRNVDNVKCRVVYPPVEEFDMTSFVRGVNHRHFDFCFRFTDNFIRTLTTHYRMMIDDNATVSDGYRCLVNSIPLEHQIGHTELCELYQYGDYLVTRTNKRIEMYTELLKYIPRYKLMADNGFLRRGLVVDKLPDAHQNLYKLMHGMTIHATQGTTVYPPRKLFICMDQEMEMRVLYTALSRVRSFDQVYLVSTYHEPDFKRRFLSPTERLTTQGPDAYDTVGPEPDMDWNAPDDDVLDSFF
jgi:hypothetical protein